MSCEDKGNSWRKVLVKHNLHLNLQVGPVSIPSIQCLQLTSTLALNIFFSDSLVFPRVFQFVFMISNFASNELLCRRLRVSLVSDSWDSREWISHAHRHIWGLIQSAVIIMITAHCSCPFGWCHGCIGSLRITQNIFQFFNNCIYHITFRSWVVWAS